MDMEVRVLRWLPTSFACFRLITQQCVVDVREGFFGNEVQGSTVRQGFSQMYYSPIAVEESHSIAGASHNLPCVVDRGCHS
jgi:hypothetical protein